MGNKHLYLISAVVVVGGLWLSAALWNPLSKPNGSLPIAPYHLLLQDQTDMDQEIAFYRKRVQINPDGFLDLAALADAYLRRARTSGEPAWYLLAEQTAQRSLNSFQNNPEALLILARVQMARHHFAEALRLTQQAEKQRPKNLAVFSNYATLYLATGNLKKALQAAEMLVKNAPGLESYTQRALIRSAQGQESTAIADLRHAIALEQTGQMESSALARTWLGRLYAKQGHLDWARALYQEALRIRPKQAVTWGLLADLEMRQKNYQTAIQHYQRAFDYSQAPIYLIGQTRAQAKLNHSDKAAALQQQAEQILRREVATQAFGHRRDLARLLLERGRPSDSAEALALMQAEMKERQDAETQHLLAWRLLRAQRWSEADKTLQQVLDSGRREAEWLSDLTLKLKAI